MIFTVIGMLQSVLKRRTRGCRGQAMIEYMIVAVMLLALVAIFALMLYALRQHSGRVLELVASEYP